MVKKILIIEDDPMALRLTEYALKQRGYQVLTTCNGLEGIIAAQKETPDLIILDIMLPGIDGFEVCQRLRAGVQTASIPILIISGKARQEDIAIGFKAGASDYLPKPAAPAVIIERVERLISNGFSGRSKVIAFVSAAADLGMPVILANVAAAVTVLGKQVTLVDVTAGPPAGAGQADTTPQAAGRVILETRDAGNGKTGPACEVLPSGIRVLHVDNAFPPGDGAAAGSIELLRKLGDVTDYLLVDLPFEPTPFARSVLSGCGLIVIAASCRFDNIYEIKNVIRVFRFLGIAPETMAAVLVDPEGAFPGVSLAGLKPYLEGSLGIELAGAVSFDARAQRLSYLETQPIILSSPGSQLARDIKQIAQYIVSHSGLKKEPGQSGVKVPHLEKG
jgi:CheY-like chemotaxis protein/MinD-like ATPase involved in chromosome partitioning or flagellar assembly